MSAVRLGGKGSAPSSSSVFHFANNVTAQLTLDSAALSRLPHSSSSSSSKVFFTIPNYFTPEQVRASLLLFLNKLLLSSAGAGAIDLYHTILNQNFSLNYKYEINAGFDYSAAAVDSIAALLDHSSSVLAVVIDAVAALSCEALRADVSAFMNLIDSGDGSSLKDEVAVASDFKVLFNGSKLVGNGGSKLLIDSAISNIPALHGNFREICRLLHNRTRVQLSSGFRAGSAKAICTVLLALAEALSGLAEMSANRAKLLVDSMPKLSSVIGSLETPSRYADCLEELYMTLHTEQNYVRFSNQVYGLLDEVWKIVSLEATLAYAALDDIIQSCSGGGGPDPQNAADDRKKEKRKVVMGKGSSALMQFIKGRTTEAAIPSKFISLDPRESEFDSLVNKVKEIVESNESRRLPKLAKGTRDFAKEQMAIREKTFAIIGDVFKRHGATALDTPVFELRETLMGKYGEDSKLIYDLADQGGELCSLRYDLTVPFARYMAMNGLTSLKRYQIAKVYRRDNPSKGRYREFYQCDFDIAGHFEKMGPDFEVIKILTELLNELNVGDYEVKLNHRKLLDGMMAICGVPQEKFRTICSSIDKLDKQSFEQIKREMVNEKGLTDETADAIGTFVKERGSPLELLRKLNQEGSKFLENSESRLALDELEILFKALEKSKCSDKVVFDLSLARGLDYYTGVIFEAVYKGATQVGSIAAGGRYDNLIGMFGTKQVPAVGVSLGIERVFAIMENQHQGMRATETQVLVSILGEDLSLATEIVSELWSAKLKAEFMVDKRIKKQMSRAYDSGIPLMVIVGEHELNEGKLKLKGIIKGQEFECDIPRSSLVEEVCRRLDSIDLK